MDYRILPAKSLTLQTPAIKGVPEILDTPSFFVYL